MAKRNALEQAVGSDLAPDWEKRVDALAVEEWRDWLGGEEVPYDIAILRLRALLQESLLPDVPTEAVLNTCFGLTQTQAKKARKEILTDVGRRYAKLKKALQSPVKETAKFVGRKVHRYAIEDFLEQDLLERSEKVEADFKRQRLPYQAPEKVRGHPRAGWDFWDIESRLVGGLLRIL